ncbi:hypothetical protein [Immundisolibacter cernigliae]|nr:hypothetical protein [Immundisolibacter cernigliae]
MNVNELLAEANRLVTGGMRKAAIDLLLEYLETDPHSSVVLSTLGRAYLLDQQLEKAVVYLRKSLEVSRSAGRKGSAESTYQPDHFDDEDFAYIESQTEQTDEIAYSITADAGAHDNSVPQPPLSIDVSNVSAVPHCHPGKDGYTASHEDAHSEATTGTNSVHSTAAALHAYIKPDETLPLDSAPAGSEEYESGAGEATIFTEQLDETDDNDLRPTSVDRWHQREEIGETDTDDSDEFADDPGYSGLMSHSDSWGRADQVYEGEPDESEFSQEEAADDEDIFIEPDRSGALGSMEEEPYELNWDDLADLDEFNEEAQRGFADPPVEDDLITREKRARQIAAEVLARTYWAIEHLPLLQQVFVENGWSAARVAVEREIENGMLPEELALARRIKRFWGWNDQFWTTFHKIRTNSPYAQADAAYKNMSWAEALRIIRSFPNLPDIEEIYAFIETEYESWYYNDSLRRTFKAFFKYLKYRTGSMRGALPGDVPFSFNVMTDSEFSFLHSLLMPESQTLSTLGINMDKVSRPTEGRMKVNQEYLVLESLPPPPKNKDSKV